MKQSQFEAMSGLAQAKPTEDTTSWWSTANEDALLESIFAGHAVRTSVRSDRLTSSAPTFAAAQGRCTGRGRSRGSGRGNCRRHCVRFGDARGVRRMERYDHYSAGFATLDSSGKLPVHLRRLTGSREPAGSGEPAHVIASARGVRLTWSVRDAGLWQLVGRRHVPVEFLDWDPYCRWRQWRVTTGTKRPVDRCPRRRYRWEPCGWRGIDLRLRTRWSTGHGGNTDLGRRRHRRDHRRWWLLRGVVALVVRCRLGRCDDCARHEPPAVQRHWSEQPVEPGSARRMNPHHSTQPRVALESGPSTSGPRGT